ncbi:PorP/SprF family type IX secretion system membrane protein [Fulvivirga ligni]|uniref:PorP/SprF family type IX secretion system membrane protein n=1 Tax=Fulvivirga ligni TaxID=2904246 RepID=UPI001F31AA84|nr:PorP/SprF family type IX secretion system membrane protein [Fulvivirga ligni]UII19714.1 PorP/SprF family type IX secretion system membrane protein [Fulvivirga ligni]
MKKALTISFIAIFGMIAWSSKAQELPVYNQFYFNPYLYNPSFVANSGRSEINATYRKQWVDIGDAPEVGALNFQYATKGNVSLGLSLQSEKSVLLRSDFGFVTFGYKVPFQGDDHYVKFGLSGGVIHNTLDVEALIASSGSDILNDPAVINALDDSYNFASQFGVHYKLKNLTLGFALPQLIENKINTGGDITDVEFSSMDQKIISASYDIELSPFISFTPTAVVRLVNKQQNQMTMMGIVNYKELIWAGAGYRYDYGPLMYLGLKVTDALQFGYSYEFNGVGSNSFSSASHEVHLKFRFKKKSKQNIIVAEDKTTSPITVAENTEGEIIEEEIREEENSVNPGTTTEEPIATTEEPIEEITPAEDQLNTSDEGSFIEDNHSNTKEIPEMTPGGFYVIIGVYKDKNNALAYTQKVTKAGYPAQISYYSKKNKYYVYLYNSVFKDSAQRMRKDISRKDLFEFKDAWVLEVK